MALYPPAGGADGVNIIGVNGNTVGSSNTVQFSNSNNVTFGLNGSTITASASYPAQSAFVFSNSNGVSWGTNGSTVTATVATNYQSQGNYLTTAMQSNAATISNIKVSAGTLSSNRSDITFNNSNGVSFGLETNGIITATVATNYQAPGAYLTTAALSDHSHGSPTLALTNISGTTASNSNGLTLSLSAGVGGAGDGYNIVGVNGNTVGSANTIQFSNSNNVTFGLNGSTITASASYINDLTSGRAGVGETVGTIAGSDLAMTVNTDGVSIGYPKWLTTAQAPGAYLTTARASNDAIGLNSALTANGVSVTANSSGLSLNFPAFLTTAMLSNNGSNFVQANAGFAGTNASGTIASNGISVSVAAPGAGGGIGIAAGTRTATTAGSLLFDTGNGITFGLNAVGGSIMTASHNGLTTAAQSDHSHGNPTLALTNLTGTTASASNGLTISLSAANPGGGAGATLSYYTPPWAASGRATNSSLGNNTLYFQPFDLPYYLSASRINFYISISGAMSAGNSTGTCWQRASYGLYSQDSAGASTQSIRLITSYAITHLSHSFTSNTRYQATHYFGLSNATSHSTQQTAISSSNATTYLATNLNGGRVLAFPLNSTMTPGRYWLAFGNATSAGNAMTNNLSVFHTTVGIQPEIRPFGQASAATNASVFRANQGWGSYSATTAAYPSLVALSTDNIRHGVAMTQIHFDILGIATSTNQI